ncbi:MAG: PEGA domain-containing protein [Candidatus Acidiferrales bacterium]
MFKLGRIESAATLLMLSFLSAGAAPLSAQDSKVMGEVLFAGDTQLDRDSGVWIDGDYVGYVKELKGNKKVLLLPGKHHIAIRQKGYEDLTQDIVVEPGQMQTIQVSMHLIPGATTPDVTSELKISVQPKRAAVFLDGSYVGHASELGGRFHSLLVSPGKHKIKIELPGYRTFETEVDVLAGQKSEVKTELVKGSIEQAGEDIKKPQ